MKTNSLFSIFVFSLCFLSVFPASACTGGAIIAEDGSVAVGRTLEFGKPLDSVLAIWPAGSEFVGVTSKGETGHRFTAKYGFLGATVADQHDMILEGINEQGLNVGLFYFPGYAEYADLTPENEAKGISPAQIGTWLLASFGTVEEVKENIGQVAALPVELDFLKMVPDVHFKVQDAAGNCITIEPRGGQLVIHDNPVRVLTNSPDFSWMLTNLNNYLNLTSAYPESKKIGDLDLAPFGMGGGAAGLPGDVTAPSRFVRMTFFLLNALPQPDSPAAVSMLFHFLNNFDIPPGMAMPPAGTAEKTPDYTNWTAVSDLKNLHFHWKTFGDQNVRYVDLKEALAAAGDELKTIEMGPQTVDSVSQSEKVLIK